MREDELLKESEGWWCRECEGIVLVNVNPGKSIGLSCNCDDSIRDISDIPGKWVRCVVRVTLGGSDVKIVKFKLEVEDTVSSVLDELISSNKKVLEMFESNRRLLSKVVKSSIGIVKCRP